MDKKKTGNLIKEARLKKGYTQQELGELVGVTNKAISRWENGESFPDVSLLDALSFTLDLAINEIVLGEKREETDDEVTLGMVQIAKLEQNRKERLFMIRSVILAVFGLQLICGIRTIVYGLYEWPVQVLYYGCAVAVFAVGFLKVKMKSSSFRIRGKIGALCATIAGISSAYSIILVCGTMTLLVKGINIFSLKNAQIGPFINYQLLGIFLVNIAVALYFIFEVFEKEKDVSIGVYLSVTGISLSMVYSDLLHRLVTPEDFYLIFILDTVVILGIIVIGMVVTSIIFRCKHSQAPLRG